jgi:hypothetical protein
VNQKTRGPVKFAAFASYSDYAVKTDVKYLSYVPIIYDEHQCSEQPEWMPSTAPTNFEECTKEWAQLVGLEMHGSLYPTSLFALP